MPFQIEAAGGLRAGEAVVMPSPAVDGVTQVLVHPAAPWLLMSITNADPGLEDHLLPLWADGRLGERKVISYAFYAFGWDPSGAHFYGLDGEAIFQHRFDAGTGAITPLEPAAAAGSNGRAVLALTNHPDGRFVLSVEERVLALYARDAGTGALTLRAEVAGAVAGAPAYWTAAVLDQASRFAYVLGHTIAERAVVVDVFAIDEATPQLRFVERQTGGDRHGLITSGLEAPVMVGDLLVVGGVGANGELWGKPALAAYRAGADGRLSAVGELTPVAPAETARVSFLFATPP